MFNKTYLYATLFACLLFTACSKEQTGKDYKTEALAVCEVFNADNWKDLPKDIQPYELQEMIANRLDAAIKTNEMREIIATIPNINIDLRYQYYKESVSELIGEPHECPAIQNYFTY